MNQISIYISWEETVINEQIRINTEKIKLRKHEKDMDLLEDNRNKEMLKSLVSYD